MHTVVLFNELTQLLEDTGNTLESLIEPIVEVKPPPQVALFDMDRLVIDGNVLGINDKPGPKAGLRPPPECWDKSNGLEVGGGFCCCWHWANRAREMAAQKP